MLAIRKLTNAPELLAISYKLGLGFLPEFGEKYFYCLSLSSSLSTYGTGD